MLNHPIGRLRLVGMLEGISFIVLLGIAMPLKYAADEPLAVRIVGSAHGALFILYLVAIFFAVRRYRWSVTRGLALIAASLIPFGPFFLDGRLKREQRGKQHAGVD